MPNCINKASLPPNLHFQTIKSDGSRHAMSSVIYIIQTGNQKFAPGDYNIISPVSCQKVILGFFLISSPGYTAVICAQVWFHTITKKHL